MIMMKYTKKGLKDIFREDLKRYKAAIGPITPEERKGLNKWVSGGNSPYDNPCLLYGENGFPMDYIEAVRINADMRSNPDDYHFGEYCDDANDDSAPF